MEPLSGLFCVGVPIALLVWAIVGTIKKRDREVKERDHIEELVLRLRTLEAQMLVHVEKLSNRIGTLEAENQLLKSGKESAPKSQPEPVPAPQPKIFTPMNCSQLIGGLILGGGVAGGIG